MAFISSIPSFFVTIFLVKLITKLALQTDC